MTRWAAMLAWVLLAGCAGAPTASPPNVAALFHDDAFAPASQRISADEVFAFSGAMQRLLDEDNASALQLTDPRRHLIDLLFRQRKLTLEYDSTRTRTAAEAFEARSGNCLSLVIMTAAFAKAIGVPVQYQSVFVDDAWSRSGDLYFASGHVNLTLGWPMLNPRLARSLEPALIIDFLPSEELQGQRSRAIAERTIVAMFMNNRAAEAMARGAIDTAYWWAREAIQQDRYFLAAFNTLGVVYQRHGQPQQAQAVFEHVLAIEPANANAMGNLVQALRAQGQDDAAQRLAERLARIEPVPPFYYFNAGMAAMRNRDYGAARDLFTKEIEREANYHEFHYWLAQALFALGNVRQAQKQLELAMQSSTTPRDHDIYSAKLDRLRAHRAQ
jgi:Tfp pilus assembly protein PilF